MPTGQTGQDACARRRSRPAAPTIAVLACGLLVTGLVTGATAYQAHQKDVREFHAAAERTFDALDDTIARDVERAQNLALMIRAGARIDVEDPPATREPASDSGLEFLAWLEPVSDSEQFRVTPLLSATGGQTVASRLLETGRDGTRASRQALERALETGELTGNRDTVVFQANGDATPGFMAFLPVPGAGGAGGTDGVIALGLRLDRLASIARDGRELTMHIFKGDRESLLLYGPGDNAGVAEHTDASALRDQLHAQREFAVASQRWTAYVTPARRPTWLSATAAWPLMGGLALTGMAGWLVRRERLLSGTLAGDLDQTRQQFQLLQRDFAATRETQERETVARTTTEHCLDLLEGVTCDAVLRLSESRTIMDASPAVAQVLGLTPDELIGRPVDSVVRHAAASPREPADADTHEQNIEQTFLVSASDGSERRLTGRLLRLPWGMSNAEREFLVLRRSEATEARHRPGTDHPFREAFDHASTGMGLFHPETGHCLYVNQALCDILGYAQDELLNMTYHDLTHPADQHATREQLDTIRNAAGDGFRVEKRYLHKTGRVLWVEVTGSMLRDSNGQELYVASQIRDITEQKQTEQALQRINHRHDLILNAAAEAIFGLDTRGRVVFANAAACHLLSREPATIEGQPLEALLRQKDDPVADDWPVQACLEQKELRQADGAVFRRGDGTLFPADYTVSPMVDDGHVTGAVVVMADASERHEGEARFRSAFEDVAVGMALIALDGHFLRANAALCSLVGHDAEELLAMRSTDLLHPDDREINYRTNRLLLDGNRPTGPVEHRLRHRDGGIVWALTSTSLVRDPGGEPRYLLKQAQDITPRKVAEAALRTSEARFRGIFEQAAVGMALLDGEETTVQRVNEALRTFLQCDVEALTGRPFVELIHQDDRHQVLAALASPNDDGGHTVQVRLNGCQGTSAAIRLRLARIDGNGSGGNPLHLVQLDPGP